MPETELAPRTALKRTNPRLPIALLAIAAALAGGALWLWRGRDVPPPPASVAAPAPTADGAAAAAAPAEEAPPAAAPADARALLEAASADPAYRRWLGEPGLVERWAAITENVALGASPRAHLPFLKLDAPFQVERRGGRSVIAPASYARYDGLADAVASVDARAVARAYRALHAPLDAAYRALGYPAGALDVATGKALRRLAAAPVPDGEVGVVDEGGIYVLEDPALERLAEVEKHLVRMGPRNARLVQAKARELALALALPPPTAPRR